MHYAQKLHENGGIKLERERYGAGSADSEVDCQIDSTATTVESTAPTLATTLDSQSTIATLQSKLTKLQAKLHKEFRWYCDTILQGGSLAVRVAYRVGVATDIMTMVDRGEVCTDEAVVHIGDSLYIESDIDKLLAVEYLLDDLYDTWCKMSHADTEWSDTVDAYLEQIHT